MKLALPICEARTVQLPACRIVTVLPATLQVVAVVLLKLTGRPDVAVALTENAALPNVLFASGPKPIV